MPLPDPHAGEPAIEIDRDLVKLYREALARIEEWTDYANKLKTMLLAQLGDAYAGTIDGEKVITHRPKNQYAVKRIQTDYPDLSEHFMRWRTEQVFDIEAFQAAHPEIAEQYRVRAFNNVGG